MFADEVPEDAANLRKDEIKHCMCRLDWVADSTDAKRTKKRNYEGFRNYPRSYPVISFLASCPIKEHAAKAGTQRHFNHWRSNP